MFSKILFLFLFTICVSSTNAMSTNNITIPTISAIPSSITSAQSFLQPSPSPNNFWKIHLGPDSSKNLSITQYWPANGGIPQKADDQDASTPHMFCLLPPYSQGYIEANSESPLPQAPAASPTDASFTNPTTNFACATAPVSWPGPDGTPLEGCGGDSVGILASNFSSSATLASVQETQRTAGNSCGPWRLAPILGTFVDWNAFSDGNIVDGGFTITVGVRCESKNSTSGVAFAAVDDYLIPASNKLVVAEALNTILFDYVTVNISNTSDADDKIVDSDPVELDWPFSGIYNVYYSLFVDSRHNTILLASTVKKASSSSSSSSSTYVLSVLRFKAPAEFFDGNWHLLALVAEKTEGGSSTVRLFVDAQTHYSGTDRLNYQRCVSDLSTVVSAVRVTPLQSLVANNSTEIVYTGGALSAFVGPNPPSLYGLQFHKDPLRAVELASMGSKSMLKNLSLQGEAAFAIGAIVAIVGLGAFISAAIQVKNEALDSDGDGGGGDGVESGDFGVATDAGQEGIQKLAAGSAKKLQKFLSTSGASGGTFEKFQMVRKLTAVLAPLLQVFQSVALLFRGFTFPPVFQKPLTYITFIFSFQFQMPQLGFEMPTWAPLAALGVVALIGLSIVLLFGWKDHLAFIETLKGYELFSTANSEYAAQVVFSFANNNNDNIKTEKDRTTAKRDGKSIATNGWYLNEKTLTELLPDSVTKTSASRIIKELGSKPATPGEAIIRRVLLVTRGHSVSAEHAREVANLLLSGSVSEKNEHESEDNNNNDNNNKAESESSSSTRSLEDIEHCFRKAGLSCTKDEAKFVMGEMMKLSKVPSLVDNNNNNNNNDSGKNRKNNPDDDEMKMKVPLLSSPTLANPSSSSPSNNNNKISNTSVFQLEASEKLDEGVLEALSAGGDGADGPSRDALEKRSQMNQFTNSDLQMIVVTSSGTFHVDKNFQNGKSWRQLLESSNHLANFGTSWTIPVVGLSFPNTRDSSSSSSSTPTMFLHDCTLQMAVPSNKNNNNKANEEKQNSKNEFKQRDFFIVAKQVSNSAQPTPFTTNNNNNTSNATDTKFSLQFNWASPYTCPVHNARLMKADDGIYDMLDDDKHPLFKCCLESQHATKLNKKLGPCRTDVLFVCSSDEKCLYSFCHSCLQPTMIQEKAVDYFTSFINLKRNPSALVSLVSFMCLQSIYLPISQSALMILACHHSQLCEYPMCYQDVTPAFRSALVVAIISLILCTVGLPVFWYLSIRSRKNKVDAVFDSPTQWEELLEQDDTSLANLYNKYEQEYMTFEPFLMVSRSLSLSAAVALTEPESLAQMIIVALINIFNTFLLAKTAPFIDCYIDIITKLDLWHSCFLVGFLCFDQASRIFLPGKDVLGIPMLLVSGIFFVAYGWVFHKTVIRAFLDDRKISKANELEREEQMWLNDDNVERRLSNLRGVFDKKQKFYGKVHLQPVLTLSFVYQSTSSRLEKEETMNELSQTFLQSIDADYDKMIKKGRKSSDDVLAQFNFRTGSCKTWSHGTGLHSLGEALREAPALVKNKIVDSLHKWTAAPSSRAEKSAKSNAFSLLVAMRVPIENLDLSNADLTSVLGRGAILRNCKLCDANLMSVDFTGATFTNCDFQGAHLEGAQFGPEHKAETASVWSAVVASKRTERTFAPFCSLNFDDTHMAVSGFGDFFVVLQTSSGRLLHTSERLPTDGIAKDDLKDLSRKNFDAARAIFSPSDSMLLYFMKHKLWSFPAPPYRTPQKLLLMKNPINSLEFSRNGEFFFARSDDDNSIFFGSVGELVIFGFHKPESSLPEWPLTCRFSDFVLIDPGDSFGEGADQGVELEIRDFSKSMLDWKYDANRQSKNNSNNVTDEAEISKLKQQSKPDSKAKYTDFESNVLHKLTTSDNFVYISHDGKFFAQSDSRLKKCLIRSFTALVEKSNNNNNSKSAKQSSKKFGSLKNSLFGKNKTNNINNNNSEVASQNTSLPDKTEVPPSSAKETQEKPITNMICSFKYLATLPNPYFFQMADGASTLVTGVIAGTTTGIAQLFSTISGRKLGELYFSLKPPAQRWKAREMDHDTTVWIVACATDRSSTFLYVLTRGNSTNAKKNQVDPQDARGLQEVYLCKILLSFGDSADASSDKAAVKTLANDVDSILFLPDSTLLCLYNDMFLRRLDVRSDIREYEGNQNNNNINNINSSSPSSFPISLNFDKIIVNPTNPRFVVLTESSWAVMADLDAKKELFIFPSKKDDGLIWNIIEKPCPNDPRLGFTEADRQAVVERKKAKEEAERRKDEERETKRLQKEAEKQRKKEMEEASGVFTKKKKGSDSDDDDSDDDDDDSDDDDDDDSDDDEDSNKSGTDNDKDDEDYEVTMTYPTSVTFAPDGQHVAIAVDAEYHDVFYWKINNGNPSSSSAPPVQLVNIFTRPSKANLQRDLSSYNGVTDLFFFSHHQTTNNSTRLLLLGFEEETSTVIIFDVETAVCLMECKTKTPLKTLQMFLPQSYLIAYAANGTEILVFSLKEVVDSIAKNDTFSRLEQTSASSSSPREALHQISKGARQQQFPQDPKYKFKAVFGVNFEGKQITGISFCHSPSSSSSVLVVTGGLGFAVYDLFWKSSGNSNNSATLLENVIPRVAMTEKKILPASVAKTCLGALKSISMSVSPDGNRLALQQKGTMKIWNISTSLSTTARSEEESSILNNPDFANEKIMTEKVKLIRDSEVNCPSKETQDRKLKLLFDDDDQQLLISGKDNGITANEKTNSTINIIPPRDNTTNCRRSNKKIKTNIFGSESGTWIFSRAMDQNDSTSPSSSSATFIVQNLLLGQDAQQQPLPDQAVTNENNIIEENNNVREKNPASSCFRRLETSDFLPRYLNDCYVDDVDEFASDPPADALEHDAILSLPTEYETDAGLERSENIKKQQKTAKTAAAANTNINNTTSNAQKLRKQREEEEAELKRQEEELKSIIARGEAAEDEYKFDFNFDFDLGLDPKGEEEEKFDFNFESSSSSSSSKHSNGKSSNNNNNNSDFDVDEPKKNEKVVATSSQQAPPNPPPPPPAAAGKKFVDSDFDDDDFL